MKLAYISSGNIPSRKAHSLQIMKMSEALNLSTPNFELLTQGSLGTLLKRNKSYLYDWYGINQPFKIKRLPLYIKLPKKFYTASSFYRFALASVYYCKLNNISTIYTRDYRTACLATAKGISAIFENHGIEDGLWSDLFNKFKSSEFIRGFVTISDVIKEDYIKRGIPENKIIVWPDAVDLDSFSISDEQKSLRMRFNLPPDKVIITYCGHLYENRGLEEIFQILEKFPQHHFLFIGGLEQDIKLRKEQTKAFNNVQFTGFVSNKLIPQYLCVSNILLMPYSDQCATARWMSPLKMFEYMASNRPIIATKIPALMNILKNNINSLLIEPNNPQDLCNAINKLASDSELAMNLSRQAFQDVQKITWKNRAKDILRKFAPELISR